MPDKGSQIFVRAKDETSFAKDCMSVGLEVYLKHRRRQIQSVRLWCQFETEAQLRTRRPFWIEPVWNIRSQSDLTARLLPYLIYRAMKLPEEHSCF